MLNDIMREYYRNLAYQGQMQESMYRAQAEAQMQQNAAMRMEQQAKFNARFGDIIDVEARVIEDAPALDAPVKQLGKS